MGARKRERVFWKPVWSKEYEGWSASFLRENKWRCDLEFEDLMQEAWLIFDKCVDTYPRVTEPANFMALFKRSMINKMHDRSMTKKRHEAVEVKTSTDVSDFFAGRIGELTNEGYIAALLAEAPEEVLIVLKNMEKGQFFGVRKRLTERKNLSMRVAEALGLNFKSDPIAYLKEMLT